MSIAHQYGIIKDPVASPKGEIKSKALAEKKPRAADKIREGLEEAIEHVKTAPIESLRGKIAEIETKNSPPPKPGKGEFQKMKKGRPKKGEQPAEKTVVMSFRVPESIANAVKNNPTATNAVIIALRKLV
jgi:hypothetical protein